MGPMRLYDFNGYPGVMDCKSRNHDAAGIIVISSSSSSSVSASASPSHILYATHCYAATRATISYQSVISAVSSSRLLCRLRALPGGEVWSYGRSNSDVQQKMLKRLEEYEEVGCWSM